MIIRRAVVSTLFSLMHVAVLGVALSLPASARETYGAFAARIVSELPEGVEVREDLETVLHFHTNRYRGKKKRKPLSAIDGKLQMAARAHAIDLLLSNDMGHRSSTGHDFEARMRSLNPGVMMVGRMAENAARERSKGPVDTAKATRLFQQWVESRGHRGSLLSRDYTQVATGVVQRGNVIYAVQIFAGAETKSNLFNFGGTE